MQKFYNLENQQPKTPGKKALYIIGGVLGFSAALNYYHITSVMKMHQRIIESGANPPPPMPPHSRT